MSKGAHIFRVRSVSLAQNGTYSPYVVVHISNIKKFEVNIGLVIILWSVLVLIGAIFQSWRQRRSNNDDGDMDILLNEIGGPPAQPQQGEAIEAV